MIDEAVRRCPVRSAGSGKDLGVSLIDFVRPLIQFGWPDADIKWFVRNCAPTASGEIRQTFHRISTE